MREKYTRALSIAWLAFWYLAACLFVAKYASNFIDADMSSELVLARLLADEGSIISKNWFYSTELRVLNTQLVFMPLFLIFDNWHVVRVLGTAILLAILGGSALYCARGMKLSWNISLICAGVLLMPISESYAYAVLKGTYYIPHICISFFLFGLFCRYVECDSVKGRRIRLIAALLLAFVSGLGGIRQVFVFTFPAALAAVISFVPSISREVKNKARRMGFVSVSALASSTIGYLVNKLVLQRIYSFSDYGSDYFGEAMHFDWFDISGVGSFINKFFELLGYRPGTLFSGTLIYNGIVAVLLVVCIFSVYTLLKGKETPFAQKYLALFVLLGSVMFLALYSCTDTDMTTRYFVPIMVFFVFTAGALLENLRIPKKLKSVFICSLLALLTVLNLNTYIFQSRIDKNAEKRDVVAVIESSGVREGYASFWNGNILTEISDGGIDTRLLGLNKIQSKADLGMDYNWLQLKSHSGTVPQGRFFLLLDSTEASLCNLNISPDYANGVYALYFFDDYADFAALYSE